MRVGVHPLFNPLRGLEGKIKKILTQFYKYINIVNIETLYKYINIAKYIRYYNIIEIYIYIYLYESTLILTPKFLQQWEN